MTDMTYSTVTEISRAMGENNDCTVRAISIATGAPYSYVHELLAKAGRKNRRGCFRKQWEPVAQQLCSSYESLGKPTRPYKGRQRGYTGKSIHKKYPTGRYLVLFRGHLAALVNGKLEDWTDDRCKRVLEVMKVS